MVNVLLQYISKNVIRRLNVNCSILIHQVESNMQQGEHERLELEEFTN
jgi:hypothetical protein